MKRMASPPRCLKGDNMKTLGDKDEAWDQKLDWLSGLQVLPTQQNQMTSPVCLAGNQKLNLWRVWTLGPGLSRGQWLGSDSEQALRRRKDRIAVKRVWSLELDYLGSTLCSDTK